MRTYTSSQLSEETLKTLVTLNEKYVAEEEWDNMQIALTEDEARRVEDLKSTLHRRNLMVLNESTLWARAIYPMLVLAERGHIQAWSSVPLKATYPTFELEGEANGALATSLGGKIRPPYLIVHEAKRGLNAPDPQFQLYGEMLAAAWLNWERDYNLEQEIFGCYTVNDSWAFVRGVVSNIETEKPTFTIEFSPDYHGISDAEYIVQLLKFIVAKQLEESTNLLVNSSSDAAARGPGPPEAMTDEDILPEKPMLTEKQMNARRPMPDPIRADTEGAGQGADRSGSHDRDGGASERILGTAREDGSDKGAGDEQGLPGGVTPAQALIDAMKAAMHAKKLTETGGRSGGVYALELADGSQVGILTPLDMNNQTARPFKRFVVIFANDKIFKSFHKRVTFKEAAVSEATRSILLSRQPGDGIGKYGREMVSIAEQNAIFVAISKLTPEEIQLVAPEPAAAPETAPAETAPATGGTAVSRTRERLKERMRKRGTRTKAPTQQPATETPQETTSETDAETAPAETAPATGGTAVSRTRERLKERMRAKDRNKLFNALAIPFSADNLSLFNEWLEILIEESITDIENSGALDEYDTELLETLRAEERTPEQKGLFNEWLEILIEESITDIENSGALDEYDTELLETLRAVQAQDALPTAETTPTPQPTSTETSTETPTEPPSETPSETPAAPVEPSVLGEAEGTDADAEGTDADAEESVEDMHAEADDAAMELYVDLSENPVHEHVSPLVEPRTLGLVDSPDVSDMELDIPDTAEVSAAQRTGAKLMIRATEQADAIDLGVGTDAEGKEVNKPVRQGFLLADHTGVGKTRQALGFLRNLRLA